MATSDLTVLLIPPPGDTALLAEDVCGGQVPRLTLCSSEWTDGDLWARPGVGCRPHEPLVHALVLLYKGAILDIGWDRFRRVWCGGGAAPWANSSSYEVIAFARAFAQDTGARVVFVRDGREVES